MKKFIKFLITESGLIVLWIGLSASAPNKSWDFTISIMIGMFITAIAMAFYSEKIFNLLDRWFS